MSCKAELRAKDFVTGAAGDLAREVLVGPNVTRRLDPRRRHEQPDKAAMVVTCAVVPKLAANAAAGKCRRGSKAASTHSSSIRRPRGTQAIEGDAVVRYWVPPGTDAPADAEIARSSGYPAARRRGDRHDPQRALQQ